jgi:hypothetical protein
MLLILMACTSPKPDSDPADSTPPVDSEAEQICEALDVDTALESGLWAFGAHDAVFNDCENSAGKGLHIHIGEDTFVDLVRDGTCLEGVSDPGSDQEMQFVGETDGSAVILEGSTVRIEVGTCVVGVTATLTGTMTASNAMDYRMDATLDIVEELSPDACSYIIGDTANHTFPELPCGQAWTGTGHLTD